MTIKLRWITQNEYDQKVIELKERQRKIDSKLKQYTEADGNFIITVSYLLDLASRARDLFLSSKVEQKRKLISFILSNVSLKGKKLVYKLNEPFDAIVQANKESNWLPRSDSPSASLRA